MEADNTALQLRTRQLEADKAVERSRVAEEHRLLVRSEGKVRTATRELRANEEELRKKKVSGRWRRAGISLLSTKTRELSKQNQQKNGLALSLLVTGATHESRNRQLEKARGEMEEYMKQHMGRALGVEEELRLRIKYLEQYSVGLSHTNDQQRVKVRGGERCVCRSVCVCVCV